MSLAGIRQRDRHAAPRVLLLETNRDGTVGGSYHCLRNMALDLRARGFVPVAGFLDPTPFRRVTEELGIETHVLPAYGPLQPDEVTPGVAPFERRARRLWNVMLRGSMHLARVLRGLEIDLLHLNNNIGLAEEWIFAARGAGLPVVVHQRGFGIGNWFNRLTTDRLVDRVLCVSDAVALALRRQTAVRHVERVWDFVDVTQYRPLPPHERARARSELGERGDRVLVGMAGNFKEWKGQHVVVEALARLPAALRERVRCLFFGDISVRPEDQDYVLRLHRLVDELDLGAVVSFAGFRDSLDSVYPALDLLVHASTAPEPFGMVVAEAMACGVPVIATEGGGPPEIIGDSGGGWLVEPGDPFALGERLFALLDDAPRRARAAGRARRRIVDHFSPHASMTRVTEIYRELLGDAAVASGGAPRSRDAGPAAASGGTRG